MNDELKEPLIDDGVSSASNSRSLWSSLVFSWVNPLMEVGYNRQLDHDDLLTLPNELTPKLCRDRLWEVWLHTEDSEQRSLLWTIARTYGWNFFAIGLLKILNDSLSFLGPVFLNAIVTSLQTGSQRNKGYGYWCACGLGGVSMVRAFLGTHYSFLVAKLRLKLRAGVTTIVFRKALRISSSQRQCFSTGEIQTLMSVDADRTVNLFASMHDLWSLPLQMAVALWMLYREVKFAFLAGLAVVVLLIPVNRWIAVRIGSANRSMMVVKDERVRRMSELLTYISTLKLYAWENLFAERIRQTREQEVKYLAVRKYLDAFCVYFWACTPTLFSVLTFATFSFLGHSLDAATVFTSLALFNILISPLNSFPWVITGIVEASVSVQRLQRFLVSPECGDTGSNKSYHNQSDLNDIAIALRDASYIWSENSGFSLKQISMDVPKGSLVVVVGSVGAGKSSLLEAILSEMHHVAGSAFVNGSIAFASQTPWIRSGTFRQNILFGRPYEEDRYNKVIRACSLDIDIKQMPRRDMSEIGERGYNLSGGQRSRLALARAVYQDCDIYLLDDPLSAVDAHVAAWILKHLIQGPLLCDKTRILCTHNMQALSIADVVIVMEEGRIKHAEAPLMDSYRLTDHDDEIVAEDGHLHKEKEHGSELEIESTSLIEEEIQENLVLVAEEERSEGQVQSEVYWTYAYFMGFVILGAILLSTFLMQASRNTNDWWLAYWVDQTGNHASVKFYLSVLFAIAGLNSLFTLLRAFLFAYGGLRAAMRIHDALLNNILRAAVEFYEKNPTGRILNRFSSDLYMIDDSLPFIANILLANVFSLAGILIVLCFVQWEFLVILLPLLYIYNNIQKYYRRTSRELRRLDSVSRSPIYNSFYEVLNGAATIRAFKYEEIFVNENADYVQVNQRASFSETAAGLWLSIRLQVLASFVVFIISFMSMFAHEKKHSTTSAGLVGLSLSYAAPIITLLNDILTAFAETEKEMISVERVQQYLDIDKEEQDEAPKYHHMFKHGALEFVNVTLRYRSQLQPALNNISFHISAREKVGIAGRTGAGKSSILSALFRLTKITSGRVMIDDIDISTIPLHLLRTKLAIVPQNPFLFEGSIRENLDPTAVVSDGILWEMLEKCHLKNVVTCGKGLDTHIRDCGESLSLGQRQLLCLARSLLKHSCILCLDECTANVDPNTSYYLNKSIQELCSEMSVLTIAHRISTIADVERVFILDEGRVVEEGCPEKLLTDPTSIFYSLANI